MDLNQGFTTFDPNLEIPVGMSDELACRQACDWYTHTDADNDDNQKPKLATGKQANTCTYFYNFSKNFGK